MAGILASGATNATATTKYTQINIQTSAQGVPIPLVWGKKRIGDNLIWYGDFQAVPEKGGKKGGGGKGGDGKGAGGVVYDYYAAIMFGLCEGPITGIGTVWADTNTTTLAALGLTLFTGSASQATWSYLTSNHPTQALSYAYTAFLANSRYSLGKSPNLPNHNFEVITPLSGSMPGTVDVNMADVILDLLTNPQYAIALPSGSIDATSLAFYKTYIQAQGLFMSPDITSQEQFSSVLDRWSKITNTWIFWSGSTLKFVPLGDTAITANGVTYTPNTAVIYPLGYDDIVQDGSSDPITVTRSDPADAVNYVTLEIKDRTNAYNTAIATWQDQGLVDQFGQVSATSTQAYEICDTVYVGPMVAQLIGQRGAYILNVYDFKLGWEIGSLLEPGDIVTLTDPHIPLSAFPVRIRTLDEDENGNWAVNAEEFPGDIATASGTRPAQAVTNTTVNVDVDPGDVNPPAIFEPASSLTGGTPQVWVAASGGANWGGAIVSISFDNVNFNAIGSISNPAAQGTLTAALPSTADPDTVDTLAIDTAESDVVLPTDATDADANAYRTLCLLTAAYSTTVPSAREAIAYGAVAAGAGEFDSNLTYLRRGLYGTVPTAFAIGDFFTRMNLNQSAPPGNTVLIYDLPAQYIGTTVYLKFQSFNRFGNATQDISTVATYQYATTGAGYGGGTGGVPATPTGLAATPGNSQIALSWNANAVTDSVSVYKLYAGHGHLVAFGSCTLIFEGSALGYTHSGLGTSDEWTYYLAATNAIGTSSPEGPADATTSAAPAKDWILYGNLAGQPAAGQELFNITALGGEGLPLNLVGSEGGCEIAPTANITCTLLRNGTSIGTMTIAAGATAATFAFASAVTFSAGDLFKFTAPATADTTLAGLFYTFKGTR